MRILARKWWWEFVCFFLLLILVSYQIFLPPVTGLANNSDFVYVLGKRSICSADREAQDKIYLVTDYFIDPVSCTWESGLTTVELPLVIVAEYLSRPFTGKKNFDLRALAAVHLLLLLAAFGILLSITSRAGPAVRYGIPALFILIFSDVAYTCYLNSAYLDAPAYLFLLVTTAIAIAACLNHRSWLTVAAYLVFGTALVFSKSQHAILGVFFAALAIVLAFRPAVRRIRLAWVAIAVVLCGSAATMLSLTPPHYKLFALYNVIFSRLTMHSEMPWDVLHEVGLGDDELKLVSSHAYVPNAPVYDDKWSEQFLRRTSFGKLIAYYLHHPDVAFSEMDRDLHLSAPVLRPTDMANFRQKDGYPPSTLATRFSLWSDFRSGALTEFPYHVLLLYLAPWFVWIAGWKWSGLRSPVMPLALVLSAAGIMEFAMAALTDALDNSRHLFVFQVITEMMILMAAAGVLQLVPAALTARGTSASLNSRQPLWARSSFGTLAALRQVDFRAALRSWAWELLALAIFLVLACYQIFVPPVTGLADNADFAKVLGPWSICSNHQAQPNRSFVTRYTVDPKCEYNLDVPTLERPLVGIAAAFSSLFTGENVFDLRFLGALHLAILAAGFLILLALAHRAPPAIRYGAPALFILIFSDVAYTAYLNSAYMDAAAFPLLVVAAGIAAVACFRHQSSLVALAYLVAGLALVFAKPQHALLGFFFGIVALVFAWKSANLRRRVRWIAIAVLLNAATVAMLALTPSNYQLYALYTQIFTRLAPHSGNPSAMLQEIGLGSDDLQYLNTNAYMPNAPVSNPVWAESFLTRTSFSDLIFYYLRHPGVVLTEINNDLRRYAPVIRPADLPNYRIEDGFPAGAMATRFSLWSSLRSAALRVFPYYVLLFYLAPWIAALLAWKWKFERLRSPLLPLALALSAAGLAELAMLSLTDAIDTARRMFLFHVITELMILLTAVGLLGLWRRPPAGRQIVEEHTTSDADMHIEVG